MADFAGYEMPLWYPAGPKEEHLAVLTKVGVFDTCHMAVILISGSGALDLLQRCFTKDLERCIGKRNAPMSPGKCTYGAFLDDRGEVIDDSIIGQLGPDLYMAVVNAGMGGDVSSHLKQNRNGRVVEIIDLTDQVGKIDVQGMMAAPVVQKLMANPDHVFDRLPYFSFKGHFDPKSECADAVRLRDGTPILLSRTGYTGEFGFEIFVASDHTVELWQEIIEAGETSGIQPCGLAARDSLRAGAVLPLSHQDIGSWPFINHPWPFALPYNTERTGFTKDFIGKSALEQVTSPEYTYAFAGYDVRKVPVHEGNPVVLDLAGHEIGVILTCVSDMSIGRHNNKIYSVLSPDKPEGFIPLGLSCGFIKIRRPLAPGDIVLLKNGKREIKGEIVQDIRPDRTARAPLNVMLQA